MSDIDNLDKSAEKVVFRIVERAVTDVLRELDDSIKRFQFNGDLKRAGDYQKIQMLIKEHPERVSCIKPLIQNKNGDTIADDAAFRDYLRKNDISFEYMPPMQGNEAAGGTFILLQKDRDRLDGLLNAQEELEKEDENNKNDIDFTNPGQEEVGSFVDISDGFYSENVTTDLENGVLTVSGNGMVSLEGVIPDEIKTSVNRIDIKDGITGIDDNAFSGFENLTHVELPESLESIGEKTFSGCASLSSINGGGNVTTIVGDAFDNNGNETLHTTITSESEALGLYDWKGNNRIADFISPEPEHEMPGAESAVMAKDRLFDEVDEPLEDTFTEERAKFHDMPDGLEEMTFDENGDYVPDEETAEYREGYFEDSEEYTELESKNPLFDESDEQSPENNTEDLRQEIPEGEDESVSSEETVRKSEENNIFQDETEISNDEQSVREPDDYETEDEWEYVSDESSQKEEISEDIYQEEDIIHEESRDIYEEAPVQEQSQEEHQDYTESQKYENISEPEPVTDEYQESYEEQVYEENVQEEIEKPSQQENDVPQTDETQLADENNQTVNLNPQDEQNSQNVKNNGGDSSYKEEKSSGQAQDAFQENRNEGEHENSVIPGNTAVTENEKNSENVHESNPAQNVNNIQLNQDNEHQDATDSYRQNPAENTESRPGSTASQTQQLSSPLPQNIQISQPQNTVQTQSAALSQNAGQSNQMSIGQNISVSPSSQQKTNIGYEESGSLVSNASISKNHDGLNRALTDTMGATDVAKNTTIAKTIQDNKATLDSVNALMAFGNSHALTRTGDFVSQKLSAVQISGDMNGQQLVSKIMEGKGYGTLDFSNKKNTFKSLGIEEGRPTGYYALLTDYKIMDKRQVGSQSLELNLKKSTKYSKPKTTLGKGIDKADARIHGEKLSYETTLNNVTKRLLHDSKEKGIKLTDTDAQRLAKAMIGTGNGVAVARSQIKTNNYAAVNSFKAQIKKATSDDITFNGIRQAQQVSRTISMAFTTGTQARNYLLTRKQRRLNLRINRLDKRMERLSTKYGNVASGYIKNLQDARLMQRLQKNKLKSQTKLTKTNIKTEKIQRRLNQDPYHVRVKQKLKSKANNGLKKIKNSKPGKLAENGIKKTGSALKKAVPKPVKKVAKKFVPAGKFAGKVLGAPLRVFKAGADVTQFIIEEIKRLLMKLFLKFIGIFGTALLWAMLIFLLLNLVAMAFMVVSTFFSSESDTFDPEKVEQATMGKVYYELAEEEIEWARNLSEMVDDPQSDTTVHGVLVNDLEYSYYDETVDGGHYMRNEDGVLLRNVGADLYIEPALQRPYDAEEKAVKGPLPWEHAPEEAYKWIKVIDGGIELQFRGGEGVPGYTSNIQCIMCCVTAAGQQFDNTEDWENGIQDTGPISNFLKGLMDVIRGISNFFKWAGSWIVDKISDAIPAVGEWATDHAAELRASVYMGYCKPLFDASHQTEYSLKLALYPTLKTLDSFLESGNFETRGLGQWAAGSDELNDTTDQGGAETDGSQNDPTVEIPAIGESDTSRGAIPYSQADLDAMIRTVCGEAGGEGKEGMKTVAEVIYNRAISKRFPNTVQGVCLAPGQFLGYKRFTGTSIEELKRKFPGCEEACREILAGGKSVLNNTNIIGFKSDRGPAIWNRWARFNEQKIYGHYFYYDTTNSKDMRIVKASTSYQGSNMPDGNNVVGDIIMCTSFESQKDIDADAKAGTDIEVVDEHQGYGCMSYDKFMMKYDDPENLYYDANENGEADNDELVEQAMPANLIEGDALCDHDSCIAPDNDVEQLVHVHEDHSDCWDVSGGGESDWIAVSPNYSSDQLGDVIPGKAGNKEQYLVESVDGGKNYSVWGVTDHRWVQDGTDANGTPYGHDEYKYLQYTFTHACKSDHTGYYCGGHLKLVVTGVILGFTRQQVSNDHSLYEGKTDEFKLAPGDEVEYDKEKLKKALDIFDCDLALTHIRYCINQDFEGWNIDNIDWAVAESVDDWASLYGIYVSYTLGGNTSSYQNSLNTTQGEYGTSGTGTGYTGTSLSDPAIKDILEQLDAQYAGDPTWPTRRQKLEYALSFVGNLGYDKGWHNKDLKHGGKSDCSGFASGVWLDKLGKRYTTSTFFSSFRPVIKKWDGNAKPGDILLHYVGGVDGVGDHALIYAGNIDGQDMSIDCTTVNKVGVTRYTHRNYYSECYYISMDQFCN